MIEEICKPTLSICIPTYNRAKLLESALLSLLPQVNAAGNHVELVVSDNHSTDETGDVVKRYQQLMPIRYFCNETNIGAAGNFVILIRDLARGEFAWVIGDDDLVRENAVSCLLEIIESHPDIDYFFLNHTYEAATRRKQFDRPVTSVDFPDFGTLLCNDTSNHIVNKWEEIIEYSEIPGVFTSIVSHIVRLRMWRKIDLDLTPNAGPVFHKLEDTFPHLCVVYPQMVGRTAYYVGYPHVLFFVGDQEWFDVYWSRIMFSHLLSFSDNLSWLGVGRRLIDKYRNTIFQNGYGSFLQVINQPPNDVSKFFFLARLLRYWRYRSLRRMFFRVAMKAYNSFLVGLRRSMSRLHDRIG